MVDESCGRRVVYPSVTRIADLVHVPYDVSALPRDRWANGQYAMVEVAGAARTHEIELGDGRVAELLSGDRVVGALGRRAATLQTVGDWESVRDPVEMDLLSIAGVLGRCTSRSAFAPALASVRYVGHVTRGGRPVTMRDMVAPPPSRRLDLPVVLIVGTSMDAGKTIVGARLVRMLRSRGQRVVAAKLTGVGRYRDVLAMRDAGADWVLDFVDAGLPSTVVPRPEFEEAVGGLLARMADTPADVAVIEAGASPLEPYNGQAAMAMLGDAVRTVALCASDPYAALGVMMAFGLEPSFVAGRATATAAGAALTARLTNRPALNPLDPRDLDAVARILDEEVPAGAVLSGGGASPR